MKMKFMKKIFSPMVNVEYKFVRVFKLSSLVTHNELVWALNLIAGC